MLLGLRVEAYRDEYSAPLMGTPVIPTDLQGLTTHASIRGRAHL